MLRLLWQIVSSLAAGLVLGTAVLLQQQLTSRQSCYTKYECLYPVQYCSVGPPSSWTVLGTLHCASCSCCNLYCPSVVQVYSAQQQQPADIPTSSQQRCLPCHGLWRHLLRPTLPQEQQQQWMMQPPQPMP